METSQTVEPKGKIHAIYDVTNRGFRKRRMRHFSDTMGLTSATRVLDVGGSPGIWLLAPCRPDLVILNLEPTGGMEGAAEVVADATQLPFPDQSFDVVFSNSVIEHVGDKSRQQAFANEVRRVGRAFYVQTPNRWFPFEPHLLTPLIHFLPKLWRRKLLRNFTVWGLMERPTRDTVNAFIDSTRLLSASEMEQLFPDSVIRRERLVGLAKSLIALRPVRHETEVASQESK